MTRCPLRRDSSTLARGAGTGLRGDSRTNYEERDGPRISANGSLGLTSGYLTLTCEPWMRRSAEVTSA